MARKSRPWRVTQCGVGVRDVVAAFGRLHGAALQTPEGASERCQEVSEDFVTHCHQHGVPAELITGGWFGEDERFPGIEVMMAGHFAVLTPVRYDESHDEWMGEVVIDWTARQFDPAAPVPLIVSEQEWRSTWRHLDLAAVAEWEARSDAITAVTEEPTYKPGECDVYGSSDVEPQHCATYHVQPGDMARYAGTPPALDEATRKVVEEDRRD